MHGLPTAGACRFLLLHSRALAVGLAGAAALPCFCSDEAETALAVAPVFLFLAGLPLCTLALDLYTTFDTSSQWACLLHEGLARFFFARLLLCMLSSARRNNCTI